MKPCIESFSVIEYLSIFTAFIYGYVATRFLYGWGNMINFRQSIRFSQEHLLWTLLTFVLLIDVWWGSWSKSLHVADHTLLYFASLLPSLIFYLISVLLFPPLSDEKFLDLRNYFDRIRRRNYLILIILFLSFEIRDFFLGTRIITDTYFNISAIGFAIAGRLSKSMRLHYFILFIGCCMLIVHIVYQQPLRENFPEIEGYSLIEYLTTFSAFIYGSIASRFFSGWGVMISKFDRITFSRDHFTWTLLSFVLLMDFWIGSWNRTKYVLSDIHYFIFSLLVPVAFYALTVIIFPVIRNGSQIDFREFFHTHKKAIYLLFGLTMVANGIAANVMEQQLMDIENLYRLIALVLTAFALITSNVTIERTVLIIGCFTLIVHSIFNAVIVKV